MGSIHPDCIHPDCTETKDKRQRLKTQRLKKKNEGLLLKKDRKTERERERRKKKGLREKDIDREMGPHHPTTLKTFG